MHLAHVTGWSHAELMTMAVSELSFWTREAVCYWNDLHRAPSA